MGRRKFAQEISGTVRRSVVNQDNFVRQIRRQSRFERSQTCLRVSELVEDGNDERNLHWHHVEERAGECLMTNRGRRRTSWTAGRDRRFVSQTPTMPHRKSGRAVADDRRLNQKLATNRAVPAPSHQIAVRRMALAHRDAGGAGTSLSSGGSTPRTIGFRSWLAR